MRYDAFISYRHKPLDMEIAKKLHKGLETFKIPKSVQKKYGKKKIARVFRDQEELPIGSDLTDNISAALIESEFLIVICSPDTPQSEWVLKEIDTFIELHDREHVLAILIAGEPEESFPPQLLVDAEGNSVEPLAADVRGETEKERNTKLKTEIMRLCAPLIGCSYDELRQRHRERKIRRIANISIGVAVVGIVFGAYSAYQASLIQKNYVDKQANQSRFYATQSDLLLEEGDRKAAALVAAAALPGKEDRPFVAAAAYSLAEALHVYDNGATASIANLLEHEARVTGFEFNEDGSRIAAKDELDNAYLWDADEVSLIHTYPVSVGPDGQDEDLIDTYPCQDGLLAVTKHYIIRYDADGNELYKKEMENDNYYSVYCEKTDVLAISNIHYSVDFYTGETGEFIGQIKNEEDEDRTFSQDMVFNKDGSYIAVSRSGDFLSKDDSVQALVAVYDFSTKSFNTITLEKNRVTEMAFTEDNCICVASVDGDTIFDLEGDAYEVKLNLFDIDGNALWGVDYQKEKFNMNTDSSIQIYARKYVDGDEVHDEVYTVIDSNIYTYDKASGELINVTSFDQAIVGIYLKADSATGFVGIRQSGMIYPTNLTSGYIGTQYGIDTKSRLVEFDLRTGKLCTISRDDKYIKVIRNMKGSKYEEVATEDRNIRNGFISTEGTYQAYEYYNEDYDTEYVIYKDEEAVTQYSPGEDAGAFMADFISDNELLVVSRGEGIIVYNCETDQEEKYPIPEDELYGGYVDECYRTNDENRIVVYSGARFTYFDIAKREFSKIYVANFSGDEYDTNYIYNMVMSNDGKHAYINCEEVGMVDFELETGKFTEIPEVEMYAYDDTDNSILLSHDESKLLLRSTDSTLKIVDTSTYEVLDSIRINTGKTDYFAAFSMDDNEIIVQNKEGELLVYDLTAKDITYVSNFSYNQIKRLTFDEEQQIVYMSSDADLVILSAENMEPLAYIPYGILYNPQTNFVYGNSSSVVYRIPFYGYEDLLEELDSQFPNQNLTDLEKIKYHIE